MASSQILQGQQSAGSKTRKARRRENVRCVRAAHAPTGGACMNFPPLLSFCKRLRAAVSAAWADFYSASAASLHTAHCVSPSSESEYAETFSHASAQVEPEIQTATNARANTATISSTKRSTRKLPLLLN